MDRREQWTATIPTFRPCQHGPLWIVPDCRLARKAIWASSRPAIILPDALNPVLTKELIYTGITRAKRWFSLIEPRGGVFEEAVRRKVKRLSGLMLELGHEPGKTD